MRKLLPFCLLTKYVLIILVLPFQQLVELKSNENNFDKVPISNHLKTTWLMTVKILILLKILKIRAPIWIIERVSCVGKCTQ